MFRWLMRGAGGLLVGFHVWLLAGQVSTGQLLEPERLFRWAIAAGLAAGIILLRHHGAALFGRRALVVWLLAGMLHVPAIANRLDSFDTPVAVSLTQLTLVSVAVGLGLRLVGRIPVARAAAIRRPDFVVVVGPTLAISSGSLPHLGSRPPPRA